MRFCAIVTRINDCFFWFAFFWQSLITKELLFFLKHISHVCGTKATKSDYLFGGSWLLLVLYSSAKIRVHIGLWVNKHSPSSAKALVYISSFWFGFCLVIIVHLLANGLYPELSLLSNASNFNTFYCYCDYLWSGLFLARTYYLWFPLDFVRSTHFLVVPTNFFMLLLPSRSSVNPLHHIFFVLYYRFRTIRSQSFS